MLNSINYFLQLIRWDKPIGSLLLLWPTLAAVWLAGQGRPHALILFIFILGTFVMRAAGCIINDYADRHWDGKVARTQHRPLVTGKISVKQALSFCGLLLLVALILVLQLNLFTILMAVVGVVLAAIYPFLKRFTNFPQLGLGVAWNWGILMAFTAEQNAIPTVAVLFYVAGLLITIAYDTMYGMVDREDDVKIGIKSTAILFGRYDRLIIAILHLMALVLLFLVGRLLSLNVWYNLGLVFWLGFIIYQHYLIKDREPRQCFKAFLNNNLSCLMVFVGVVLAYCR